MFECAQIQLVFRVSYYNVCREIFIKAVFKSFIIVFWSGVIFINYHNVIIVEDVKNAPRMMNKDFN